MSKFSEHNFKGQKALIRVDFNVPLDDKYKITDDTRMRASVPTIQKIIKDGGSVILMRLSQKLMKQGSQRTQRNHEEHKVQIINRNFFVSVVCTSCSSYYLLLLRQPRFIDNH